MALHSTLPIYKVTYQLLVLATEITRNMPRDFKVSMGTRIREECLELGVRLNASKTVLQPIERGVDFAGQVIKPWYRRIRPRAVAEALGRTRTTDDLVTTANSYFGLLRQAPASWHDRALLANVVRKRGHAVNRLLTKAYTR